MADPVRFLHITDTHITGEGVPFKRDDLKVRAKGIDHPTREGALKLTLDRLGERLQDHGHRLDAVIFSGDATLKGAVSGHKALLEILLGSLGSVGITAERIVATPGNHDIPVGTDP